ncbi:MAG: STAS domain-containing protein [Lachnospiraceae bacterium]|nr:STAS domain-containing protein [Lachnospiraceae bacterium]
MQETIYRAPERIDGNNAAATQEAMLALVAEATAAGEGSMFVADMTDTGYLSSAGLRALTVVQKKMRAAKGSFVMRNVSDSLRDLLDVTGLSGYLPIE